MTFSSRPSPPSVPANEKLAGMAGFAYRIALTTYMEDGKPAEAWVQIGPEDIQAARDLHKFMQMVVDNEERVRNAFDPRYSVELSWAEKKRAGLTNSKGGR